MKINKLFFFILLNKLSAFSVEFYKKKIYDFVLMNAIILNAIKIKNILFLLNCQNVLRNFTEEKVNIINFN